MMQCNFIELNTITFEAFYVAKHGSICNQTCAMVCVCVCCICAFKGVVVTSIRLQKFFVLKEVTVQTCAKLVIKCRWPPFCQDRRRQTVALILKTIKLLKASQSKSIMCH